MMMSNILGRLWRLIRRDSVAVFLILWLVTGLSLNGSDQKSFNLQQMGVDAIVTHGTFTLGHSKLKILKPLGDTFRSERGIVAAKQPGQFIAGAIVYAGLSALGITYENNYLLTASLVTWLTVSFLSSLALTLLYQMLKLWWYRWSHALWAVLSVWLFSHWLVFAGILHHDILAGGYLVIALFCSEKNLRAFGGNHIVYGIGAGFFAGVTLLTSMLPALIVFALAVYIVMSWRLKPIVLFGIGCLLGLLPLTVYNFYYFGNPLIQANVAGNYADTFFNFNFEQFIFRVNAYIGYGGLSIWKYAPLLGLGFGGILVLPKSLRMVKVFVLAAITLHLFYLFNIETLGTCQYGPRYLLPLLPFLAIGVAELMQRASRLPAFFTGGFFGIAAAYSFWVSMVGAVGGAMQCDLRNFTFVKYLASSSRLSWGNLPLFWPLFVLFLLLLVCLIVTNRKHLQAYFCTQSRLQ